MVKANRSSANPLLTPNKKNMWEGEAVFNGSPVKANNKYHIFYRAISSPQIYYGINMKLSSIGLADSSDGVKFKNRKQIIAPEHKWELFGCEDPRVTEFEGKYYIFYTALSDYPHTAEGIKVGLAVSTDLNSFKEKHQVTHFNSKAAVLFPERIEKKIAIILTANPDSKPAKIAIALFDREEQMWSKEFWEEWYQNLDNHTINLQRHPNDHVEVGAPPIKTDKGWLLIYSYIKNYLSPPPTFGIEAVLLDLKDPQKIVARTTEPLLVPEKKYEIEGNVGNIIFPSGALMEGSKLKIYYGATDTTVCMAGVDSENLIGEMMRKGREPVKLKRYKGNPIITAIPGSDWESKLTFNPAAVYEDGRVHIVYRAENDQGKSVLGYASSSNGYRIDERFPEPIYASRADTKRKINPIYYSCEDPRITKLGDRFYMCYTAFDGKSPTIIALTSISVNDFLNKNWNWEKPIVISNSRRSDKNSCIFPEKINGKYVFFHRLEHKIWIDYVDDLKFSGGKYLDGKILMEPRENSWDSEKIGIAGPPLKTPKGWLLIYHGLSKSSKKYRLSAALLDLEKPDKVLCRLPYPILEPEADYEKGGLRPDTVFACGSVLIDGKVLTYYGGADQYVAVATVDLSDLLDALKENRINK